MSRTDSPMEQDATLVEPFTREDVMKRTVPWRNYADAGLITAKDLELITNFDKKEPDMQQDMISDVCGATQSHSQTHLSPLFLSLSLSQAHTFTSFLHLFNTGEEGQEVHHAAVHSARQDQHSRAAAVRGRAAERACRRLPRPCARPLHRGQQDHGHLHPSVFVCALFPFFSPNTSPLFLSHTPMHSAIRRVDSDWFLNKEASNLLRLLLWFVDLVTSHSQTHF